jgi:hypothetical protein
MQCWAYTTCGQCLNPAYRRRLHGQTHFVWYCPAHSDELQPYNEATDTCIERMHVDVKDGCVRCDDPSCDVYVVPRIVSSGRLTRRMALCSGHPQAQHDATAEMLRQEMVAEQKRNDETQHRFRTTSHHIRLFF